MWEVDKWKKNARHSSGAHLCIEDIGLIGVYKFNGQSCHFNYAGAGWEGDPDDPLGISMVTPMWRLKWTNGKALTEIEKMQFEEYVVEGFLSLGFEWVKLDHTDKPRS